MNQEININQILYTKNGKLIGNAIINKIDLKHNQITIVTDLGEKMIMPYQMINNLFEFGEVNKTHKNAYKGKVFTIDEIISDVSEYRKIPIDVIVSIRRKREIVLSKMLITVIARQYTPLSTTKIAERVNRKHCNILHYLRTAENEKQFELQNLIKEFKEKYKYSN